MFRFDFSLVENRNWNQIPRNDRGTLNKSMRRLNATRMPLPNPKCMKWVNLNDVVRHVRKLHFAASKYMFTICVLLRQTREFCLSLWTTQRSVLVEGDPVLWSEPERVHKTRSIQCSNDIFTICRVLEKMTATIKMEPRAYSQMHESHFTL